ncbi:Nuclear receptor 2C2-associated protein, partial [Quaeritorhiza haematococci]
GSPQWISLEFPSAITPTQLKVTFQGGFAGKECTLLGSSPSSDEWSTILNFYPADINTLQTFAVEETNRKACKKFRIVFNGSTDFYGRVTVYTLDIVGEVEGSS